MGSVRLPAEIKERTVPALLKSGVDLHPDRVALIAHSHYQGEEKLTYSGLWDRASRLATVFRSHGVGRGDTVAILASNSGIVDAITTYHATHLVGAVNVPLNGRYVERELSYVLDFVRPKVIVFTPEYGPLVASIHAGGPLPLLLECCEKPTVGIDLRQAFWDAEICACANVSELEDADWIFTSGTTGNPKAVAITHGSSVACGYQSRRLWGLGPQSIYSSSAPFFTSTGCHTNLLAVLAAGCTYLCEQEFDVEETVRNIGRHSVTSIFIISGMLELILQRHGRESLLAMDLSPLERLCYGAQPMPASLYRRVDEIFRQRHGLELVHLYGLTEGGTSGMMVPLELHEKAVALSTEHGMSIGSEGFNSWVEYRIVDEQGGEQAEGEAGEICLRGPAIMNRYVDEPEAPAEALRGGWLHTGDIGLMKDGFVYFVDRLKQMIRRGGLNISSAEVEGVIRECLGVKDAAVIAVPNPVLGEEVGVFVVKSSEDLTEESLLAFCGENLSDYKIPVRVAFVRSLPRNDMGRILKRALAFD